MEIIESMPLNNESQRDSFKILCDDIKFWKPELGTILCLLKSLLSVDPFAKKNNVYFSFLKYQLNGGTLIFKAKYYSSA
jgi:hypothetical protein